VRKGLIIDLVLVSLGLLVGIGPVFADCHSEHAACVKGAGGPLDSVACGSLYRSCAAHQAHAAQQQAKQKQNKTPAAQNTPYPSGGLHSGRR